MNSWWALYGYEMKKLLRRRSMWVVMGVCLLILIFSAATGLMGSYYGGGNTLRECYEIFVAQRRARETVSGRKIDQALLEEMSAAYRKIPSGQLWEEGYEKTEEYQAHAMPYCEILELVRAWTNMNFRSAVYWEPSQERLYEARRGMVERYCRALGLSEKQRAYWMEKESQLPEPMSYVCNDAYYMAIALSPMMGIWLMLVVAVGMCGMFAEERVRGTDQVILSCPKGRGSLYWAKLLAGISVAALCALLMVAVMMGSVFCVYGTGGFEAPIQFFFPYYAYPLTMGQACLILYGIAFLAAMLDAVFVMVLSELTGSPRATLILAMGILLLGDFVTVVIWKNLQMPQLWHYSPMICLWHQAVFDMRPVTLLGHCFAVWQTVPAVQLLYGVFTAVAGRAVYVRHQVRVA